MWALKKIRKWVDPGLLGRQMSGNELKNVENRPYFYCNYDSKLDHLVTFGLKVRQLVDLARGGNVWRRGRYLSAL